MDARTCGRCAHRTDAYLCGRTGRHAPPGGIACGEWRRRPGSSAADRAALEELVERELRRPRWRSVGAALAYAADVLASARSGGSPLGSVGSGGGGEWRRDATHGDAALVLAYLPDDAALVDVLLAWAAGGSDAGPFEWGAAAAALVAIGKLAKGATERDAQREIGRVLAGVARAMREGGLLTPRRGSSGSSSEKRAAKLAEEVGTVEGARRRVLWGLATLAARFDVDVRTIRRWANDGFPGSGTPKVKLPVRRFGGRLCAFEDEVETFADLVARPLEGRESAASAP